MGHLVEWLRGFVSKGPLTLALSPNGVPLGESGHVCLFFFKRLHEYGCPLDHLSPPRWDSNSAGIVGRHDASW